jgi:hypothetical protein
MCFTTVYINYTGLYERFDVELVDLMHECNDHN